MIRPLALLPLAAVLALAACSRPAAPAAPAAAAPFDVVETGIPELQAALREGRVTSRELTARYLERIAAYEDRLNAIITVNPRALAEAEAMDKERAAGTDAVNSRMASMHAFVSRPRSM